MRSRRRRHARFPARRISGRAADGAAGSPARRHAVQGAGRAAADGEEPKDPAEAAAESDYDEDDMENSLSLAAIEAELKPKVVETFDNIADNFKKLRRLQEQDIENRLKNTSLSPAQERKYKKLKEEIIAEVKSLRAQSGAHRFAWSSSSTTSTSASSPTKAG